MISVRLPSSLIRDQSTRPSGHRSILQKMLVQFWWRQLPTLHLARTNSQAHPRTEATISTCRTSDAHLGQGDCTVGKFSEEGRPAPIRVLMLKNFVPPARPTPCSNSHEFTLTLLELPPTLGQHRKCMRHCRCQTRNVNIGRVATKKFSTKRVTTSKVISVPDKIVTFHNCIVSELIFANYIT